MMAPAYTIMFTTAKNKLANKIRQISVSDTINNFPTRMRLRSGSKGMISAFLSGHAVKQMATTVHKAPPLDIYKH